MTNKMNSRGRNRAASVFLISPAYVLKSFYEVVKNLGRNHNAVAVGTYFLCDAHHTASGVALEVYEKGFTVCDDFFCANDVVVHCRNA